MPAHGGAVMAINHVGYLDFTYAGLAVSRPPPGPVHGQGGGLRHRVSGPLMRGMHHIPVTAKPVPGPPRRGRRVANGEIVGVFPEATISRSFELKDFKAGAARMAAEAARTAAAHRHLGLAAGLDEGTAQAARPDQDAHLGVGRRTSRGVEPARWRP